MVGYVARAKIAQEMNHTKASARQLSLSRPTTMVPRQYAASDGPRWQRAREAQTVRPLHSADSFV